MWHCRRVWCCRGRPVHGQCPSCPEVIGACTGTPEDVAVCLAKATTLWLNFGEKLLLVMDKLLRLAQLRDEEIQFILRLS